MWIAPDLMDLGGDPAVAQGDIEESEVRSPLHTLCFLVNHHLCPNLQLLFFEGVPIAPRNH